MADDKEGRLMRKNRMNFLIAGIIAVFLAGGTVLAEESDSNMMIHPRAQIEYQEEERTVFIVQVGTFSLYQDAERFAGQLENDGFYTDIEWKTDNLYRVNSGEYELYTDAQNKEALLKSCGYDCWIREEKKNVLIPISGVEYFVQVGAFAQKDNADNYVKKLMTQGFGGYSRLESDGLYRVYCGSYEKKEDAEYLKGILESYGYEVYIREDEFGHETLQTYFVVQAGAFSNSENAQNYAAELNRAGINAYATLMENGYYMVFCGTFKNKDNADRLKDSIVSAGYEAVVIEYQM